MKKTMRSISIMALAGAAAAASLAGCGSSSGTASTTAAATEAAAEAEAAAETEAAAEAEASGTEEAAIEETEAEAAAVTFDKTIKLVVPYDAGGGVYNDAIIISSVAQDYLGVTVDVVCMSGNGGQEGIEYVYDQDPDGYTLLATDYGPLISTAIEEDVIYELDEFTPIIEMSQVVPTFFVTSDSPYESMEQLIEAGKENPGTISVAHGKFHSVPHLPLILLEEASGAVFNEVATSGGSEALAFTLGGSVDVGASVPSTIAASVESGDLRVLAVAAEERAPEFPDAPTLKELGYDISMPAWYTIFCRSDVPQDVRDALEEALAAAMASDEATELASASNITLTGTGSADSQAMYETTIDNLTKLLTE